MESRDGAVYVMSAELNTAIEVALAAERPLLLRGEPGSGKSSLAPYEAVRRGWRYYEHVVTARTQATDLLWTFDSVRRLADAQAYRYTGSDSSTGPWQDFRYVMPGPLWWAFAPESARRRGADKNVPKELLADDPGTQGSPHHAVVLIDEIDKADPDLPNGLLVPLGSGEFRVAETGTLVCKEKPSKRADSDKARHLVVITTNDERELPQAFLRRCVVAWLPKPDKKQLMKIADAHLSVEPNGLRDGDRELADALADALLDARNDAKRNGIRMPSTAEFLDALRACRQLPAVRPGAEEWKTLRELVFLKSQQPVKP